MLSGNGRHRRPRQAPALLVAAGVTGSAIAIPLLGATGASAATGTTWDQVAECESGGSWSEDAGNGYYGGLQLSQDNWEEYGGLEYASSADQASRNQQIAVAEKLLDDQGLTAWPTCGLLAGLSKDDSSDDVDTGVAGEGSSDESSSSGLSNSSESSSSSESASPTPSDSASDADADAGTDEDATDNPAKSDTSAGSDASDSQKTGSSPTEPAKSDNSDNSQQTVGSSSLVDTGSLGTGSTGSTGTGRHRGGSAEETSYTVREGDTLASIADSLDLQGGWRHLYAVNKKAIGTDPSSIVPGQTLELGAETGEK